MRQFLATGRPKQLLLALLTVVSVAGSVSQAAAQDAPGPPVGAVVPAAYFGSTVAAAVRLESASELDLPRVRAITGTDWLLCDPAAEDCAGLRPRAITMQTMPRWDLRIRLPRHFELRGHVWTMSHEDVDRSMRQAIVGGTLRHRAAGRWAEVGVGFAERATERVLDGGIDASVLAEDAAAGGDSRAALDRLGPALLAGIGVSLAAGSHMRFDLRLRGGLGVSAGAEGVYHCNLGVAFVWR